MVRNCVWFSGGWGKDERRGVEDLDVGVDVDVDVGVACAR